MRRLEKRYKVLIVDDDPRLREMTRLILDNRGYEVCEAENGFEATQVIDSLSPDIILMDVMMPVMDGIQACMMIRKSSKIPIIMLTAKGEDYDQVLGLECGADDYVVKPFTPMVLVARIEAVLRRYGSDNSGEYSEILIFERLEINLNARVAKVDGTMVELNKKEFDLLVYLVQNVEISLSRDKILENVWGYDYLGTESTVDTHINRLRNKLGDCSVYLKTVRGFGYKFGG